MFTGHVNSYAPVHRRSNFSRAPRLAQRSLAVTLFIASGEKLNYRAGPDGLGGRAFFLKNNPVQSSGAPRSSGYISSGPAERPVDGKANPFLIASVVLRRKARVGRELVTAKIG